MNNKGQMQMLGGVIVTFVVVIIALALFNGGVTSFVASTTDTQTNNNQTFTAAAVNSSVNIDGRAVVGTPVVTNATGGQVLTGFTFQDNQVVNGELTATMTTTDTASDEAGLSVNVSYTYEPTTYIGSSGGRGVAALIIVFFALAIGLVALRPVLENTSLMSMFSR